MDVMNLKLMRLENQAKKTEKDNKLELTAIRKELNDGLNYIEEKVTDSVVGKLKPKISELQNQVKIDVSKSVQDEIVKVDIPSLIQKEVEHAIMILKKQESEEEEEQSSQDDKETVGE